MAEADLAAFAAHVVADRALTLRLVCLDDATFAAAVVAEATERGFDVTGADVETALRADRHRWLVRWID